MTNYRQQAETAFIKHFITKTYPTGLVSYVADSFDFFRVLTECLPKVKDEILNRDGKFICRPDSGTPELIICGDKTAPINTPVRRGALECLWGVFGGTINKQGYKVLNPKVGLIYGDSITLERAESILARMKEMGFAASNIILGVGSYSYQYVTRDTFGFAMKATYGVVNGKPQNIFKDPITDSGVKKSAKGLIKVIEKDGEYSFIDEQETTEGTAMNCVFMDGKLLKEVNFGTMRGEL